MDWLTARCGLPVMERGPRHLRAAVRHLDSPNNARRLRAETELQAALPGHARSLLHRAARSGGRSRAIRATLLLTQMQDRQGRELLHQLIQEPGLRQGEQGENLRHAARLLLTPERYAQQARGALALLEQRPESCRAIALFRQATEILRFMRAPLPSDILDRALVVRTVGGENLSMARAALRGTLGVDVEHICLIRKEAVLMLLHAPDHSYALKRLLRAAAYPNPAVQLTALFGLAELNDPRGVDVALPIAQDDSSPIQEDAREVLARLNRLASAPLTLLRASERQPEPAKELLRSTRPFSDDYDALLRSSPHLQTPGKPNEGRNQQKTGANSPEQQQINGN